MFKCGLHVSLKHRFQFSLRFSMSTAISELLQRAVTLHQQGQLAAAESLYAQVLQLDAQQFDALHLIGVIAQQRGDLQSAMNFFGKALTIDTKQPQLHCNLGACLHQMERHQEALSCYDLALQLQTDYVLAWINRGNVLRSLERFEEAIRSYEKAMELKIDEAEAYYQRGLTLQVIGLHEDALLDFEDGLRWRAQEARWHFARGFSWQQMGQTANARQAYLSCLRQEPQHMQAHCNLAIIEKHAGNLDQALTHCDAALAIKDKFANAHLQRAHILKLMHKVQEAGAAYRRAGECGIDAAQIEFLLASLGEHAAPEAAPKTYVRDLFDQYATHFDHHLQQQLQYQIPQLLQEALSRHVTSQVEKVLDLGCGTGLCAPFLRPQASHLIGVDISAAMLERASQLDLYDQLVCDDIQHFLEHDQLSYDVILMADVLVYFGKLESLFEACAQHLKPGALLAFSVEQSDADEYELQSSQRYAHSTIYLNRLAESQGWVMREMRLADSRREGDQMLQSLICVWQKK